MTSSTPLFVRVCVRCASPDAKIVCLCHEAAYCSDECRRLYSEFHADVCEWFARRREWDFVMMTLAANASAKSEDPSFKVGVCVVAVRPDDHSEVPPSLTAFNGLPNRFSDPEEIAKIYADPDLKAATVEHAETRALRRLADIGAVPATLYVTAAPCYSCCTEIVKSGAREVVYGVDVPVPEKWRRSCAEGSDLLETYGISSRPFRFS